MDTFELFNNGKLALPEKEAGFAEIEWSKHPTFKGAWLKHILWLPRKDLFLYHMTVTCLMLV